MPASKGADKQNIFFFTVVELPDEPDGKKLEVYFEREGQVEASTQTTRPAVMVVIDCLICHNVM